MRDQQTCCYSALLALKLKIAEYSGRYNRSAYHFYLRISRATSPLRTRQTLGGPLDGSPPNVFLVCNGDVAQLQYVDRNGKRIDIVCLPEYSAILGSETTKAE